MSKDNLKETEKKPETAKPDDNMGMNVSGHILIRDKDTGQELVNKRNAIHYGNMAYIVAQALISIKKELKVYFQIYLPYHY